MLKEVVVKIYPSTTGVKGVLYIDKGETRGVLPLKYIKRIKDRIKLRILL
jgi:hypothetical protein